MTTATKFGVGDTVRFVGTDQHLAVREYNPQTLEYQIRRGDDPASSEWVSGIYLELVESACRSER
jgi:hypothetical protein